jgi:5-methylcytosine-specific restriction endonuclease McrA
LWKEGAGGHLTLPAAIREEIFTLISQGFPAPRRTWWEADHIVPVEKGGGGSGLPNFQTLCCACHRIKTREHAAERAQRRKAGNCPKGDPGIAQRAIRELPKGRSGNCPKGDPSD